MIGIIVAMSIEADAILKLMTDKASDKVGKTVFTVGKIEEKEAVVAVAGIGKVAAAISAQTMILKYSPEIIINSGVGGALSPNLKVGDIVVASSSVQHDMDTSPLGDPVGLISGINIIELPCQQASFDEIIDENGKTVKIQSGVIASGDQFIVERAKKEYIAKTFSADICEMEGAAIAQACYQSDIPCVIIRTVSDSLEGSHVEYEKFKYYAAENSARAVKMFFC